MKRFICIFLTISLLCGGTVYANGVTPSSWAEPEVNEAISLQFVRDELQDEYQTNITRKEFAGLALCFLGMQYGYPYKEARYSFEEDFLTYYEKADGTRFDMEDYTGPLPSTVRYSWRYVLENIVQTFSDYPESTGQKNDINFAYLLGIIQGRGNGIFDPDGFITRQEAAAMLQRTYALLDPDYKPSQDLSAFYDKGDVALWARESVSFVSGLSVMIGDEHNNFSPLAFYTREQAIITFLRLFHSAPISRDKGTLQSLKNDDNVIAFLTTSRSNYIETVDRVNTDICTVLYCLYDTDGSVNAVEPTYVVYLVYPDGQYKTLFSNHAPFLEVSVNSEQTTLTIVIQHSQNDLNTFKIDLRTGNYI